MVGIREGNSPYRETHECFLPKFSPEATLPVAEAAPGKAVNAAPNQYATREPGASEVTMKPNGMSMPAPAEAKLGPEGDSWLTKLLRRFRRPASKAANRLAPMTRRQVQCEFSLEEVKVVRNDFKDNDVEVVPWRSAAVHEDLELLSLRRGNTGESATFLARATRRMFRSR